MDKIVVQYELDVKNAVKSIDKVKKDVGALGTSTKKTFQQSSVSMGKFGSVARGVGASVKAALGPIAAAFAIAQVVKESIEKVKEFETAVAGLQSITGLENPQIDAIKEQVIELGKNGTRGATEYVNAMSKIGSNAPALLENADLLLEVTKNAGVLADAGLIPLDQAAAAVTGSMNQFGLDLTDSNKVIQALAAGSKFGSAGIAQLNETFRVSGTILAANNVTFEESVALAEVLAEKQQFGAVAGTSLTNVTNRLAKAGFGVVDGQFKIAAALEDARKALENTESPSEKAILAGKLFGEGMSATAGIILTENIPALEKLTGQVTNTTVATKQAEINNDTLSKSLEALSAKWESLVLQTSEGTGVGLGLKVVVDLASELLTVLDETLQAVGGVFSMLGEQLGSFAEAVGSLLTRLGLMSEETSKTAESSSFLADVWGFLVGTIEVLVAGWAKLTEIAAKWINTMEVSKVETGLFGEAIAKIREIFAQVTETVRGAITELRKFLGLDQEETKDSVEKTTEEIKKQSDANKASGAIAEEAANISVAAEGRKQKAVEKTLNSYQKLQKLIKDLGSELQVQSVDGQINLTTALKFLNAKDQAQEAKDLLKFELDKLTELQEIEFAASLNLDDQKLTESFDELQESLNNQTIELRSEDQTESRDPKDTEAYKARQQANAAAVEDAFVAATAITDILQNADNERLDQIEENYSRQSDLLDEREAAELDKKNLSEAARAEIEQSFARQRQILDNKAEKDRIAIENRQAKREKALAIASAVINLAKAIAAANTVPFPANIAAIIAAGATGAAQIAAIKSTKVPQFEDGGIVGGKLHTHGGTLIEAEKGEYVLNRAAVSNHLPLIEAINSGKFESYNQKNHVLPQLSALTLALNNNKDFSDNNLLESDKDTRRLLSQMNKNLIRLGRSQQYYR